MRQTANLQPRAEAGLVRGIGRWSLVAVAINGIIGAGIFGIPSEVFKTVGVYSIGGFAACAIVVALIVGCFAEVGSRFEGTGGPYLYARQAFGRFAGFEVGWLMWLARLTGFAANLNLLVQYVGFFWPDASSKLWRPVIIIGVTLLLSVVNLIGVRDTARATNVFTIGKLLPILLFIGVGLFFINRVNFTPGPLPSLGSFSQSVLLLVYAFSGFEMAVIPAGEIQNPRRNVPIALLTGIGVVAVVYMLVQVVCVGTLPELASSARPLADASRNFMGSRGAALIAGGAIVSIFGNLIVLVLAASRLLFAMGERDELPEFFSVTHPRFHTPHFSIMVNAVILAVITLSGTFIYAASVSVISRLLAYAATCASVIAFRKRPSAPPALFKLPGANVLAVAALLLTVWLLGNSKSSEAITSAIAATAGAVLYLIYRLIKRLGESRAVAVSNAVSPARSHERQD